MARDTSAAGAIATQGASHVGPADWLQCPAVAEALARVDGLLIARARRGGPLPVAAAPERFLLGGKRLRATMVLLAATLGPRREGLIEAAAVPEMLHAGSLFQDDVMDRASTRRGSPALYRVVGTPAASLFATHLYCAAFRLVTALPVDARRRAVRAALDLCRGQGLELARQGDPRITSADYLRIVHGKTASLFAVAAWLGARIGGASRAHRLAAEKFARRFGVLYQLVDDLLDLYGDARTLGKPAGSDLERRVYTLPVVYWLESAPGTQALAALQDLENADATGRQAFVRRLERDGAVARVLRDVERYRDRAASYLAALPAGPARASLQRLVDALADTPLRIAGGPIAREAVDRRAAGSTASPLSVVETWNGPTGRGDWPVFLASLVREIPWLQQRLAIGERQLPPRLRVLLADHEATTPTAAGLAALAPALLGGANDAAMEASLGLRLVFAAERCQRSLRGDGRPVAAPILTADLLLCEFMASLTRLGRRDAAVLASAAESFTATAATCGRCDDARLGAARRRMAMTALDIVPLPEGGRAFLADRLQSLLDGAEKLESAGVRGDLSTGERFTSALIEDTASLAAVSARASVTVCRRG